MTRHFIMFNDMLETYKDNLSEDKNKQEYYDCLRQTQLNNSFDSLIKFCKKEQIEYYNNIKDLIVDSENDKKI